jgi:hypothetical protein
MAPVVADAFAAYAVPAAACFNAWAFFLVFLFFAFHAKKGG